MMIFWSIIRVRLDEAASLDLLDTCAFDVTNDDVN
jgi:hypothetical protein